MKVLLFVLLAGYAAKCDDNNYYVVEVQEERSPPKPFKVYWNVPTKQCRSKKIPFDGLHKFGIIQNDNDAFRGEKVTILYDPGLFPALLKNESSGKFKFRNGGVPQEGDLAKHLEAFKNELDLSIPDKNFDGISIIDFESWRPVYRQNFGVLRPYQDVSYEIERNRHWMWHKKWIEQEAKRRFEESARTFMQTTLAVAKQLRPRAQWGYYGFPYCFNIASNNMKESCAARVPEENDRINWLFHESTALYPSVYSSIDLSTSQLSSLIRGRVREAARFHTHILPYFWYKYRDATEFLSEVDLNAALKTFYESNATGFIIWGSSNDVNTVEKCNKLHDYIENVFGPAVAKYTKLIQRDSTVFFNDRVTTVNDEISTTTENRVKVLDPEYHWIPPENYTQDIKDHVAEEIKKKLINYTETDDNTVLDNNILIDLILNSILNSNLSYVENTTKNNVDREITIVEEANGLLNESSSNAITEDSKAFEVVTNAYDKELEATSSTESTKSFDYTTVDQTQDLNTFSDNRAEDVTIVENKNEKKHYIQRKISIDVFEVTTENLLSTESTESNDLPQKSTKNTLEFSDERNEFSTKNIESTEKSNDNPNVDVIETTTAAENYVLSETTTSANTEIKMNLSTTESNDFTKPEDDINAKPDLNKTNKIIGPNITSLPPEIEEKLIESTQKMSTEPQYMTEKDSTNLVKETSLAPPTTPNQVSGSAPRVSRSQSLFCFIFYIYSISKCLCSTFGQCF